MAGLAGVGAGVEQGLAGGGELVDGVELPGQVVEADGAAPLGAAGGADAEQAEVVVVARAGQAQEGGVGAGFAGDDLHAEHVGVEAHDRSRSATKSTAWLRRTGEKVMAGPFR